MKKVQIRTDFIKLDSFLKLAGITETGGQAKQLILLGKITVNGNVCLERGKKIREKDVVAYEEEQYEVSKTGDKKDTI